MSMPPISVTRPVVIPDLLRISRYQRAPELGPRILFFSGGSALNGLARRLKGYSHNTIHLVTPFDSGGSSARLRQAFAMPAVGDLRSRLMALADESVTGNPDVCHLFSHRLAADQKRRQLLRQLQSMAVGSHPLSREITHPMRKVIGHQIGYFLDQMPENFDLRGASVGNLILTGGYLNNQCHLDPIIFLFSKLVNVLGTVRAVVNDNYHLSATLESGEEVLGQHLLTGKEVPEITSGVARLSLTGELERKCPVSSSLRKRNRKLIAQAELICFPMGSFYSSLIANLLPRGVGAAVAANPAPKLYIPNLGHDPEQLGLTLGQQVERLLRYLRADAGGAVESRQLLNFLLLDPSHGPRLQPQERQWLQSEGIVVIETPLVKGEGDLYDPDLLSRALLSLT